jgi:hypothetical protein
VMRTRDPALTPGRTSGVGGTSSCRKRLSSVSADRRTARLLARHDPESATLMARSRPIAATEQPSVRVLASPD